MPYFLSNSITDAMTTEEQSVSGMKPILTSFFSGASEPAAHAPTRTASGTMLISPDAVAAFRKSRFFIALPFDQKTKKAPALPPACGVPNAFVPCGRFIAPACYVLRKAHAISLLLINKGFLKNLRTAPVQ
jgi:hypothetical protein